MSSNAARVGGAHGIVRADLLRKLNSVLHGQTEIKKMMSTRKEFGKITEKNSEGRENSPIEWPTKVVPSWTKAFECMSSKAARDMTTKVIRTN